MGLIIGVAKMFDRHRRVFLCRRQARMPEQFLNRAQVVILLQQSRREAVPERVAGDPLIDSGRHHRLSDMLADRSRVNVMAPDYAGYRVGCQRPGWKYKLPPQFVSGVGILSCQSIRHEYLAAAVRQVNSMQFSNSVDLRHQRGAQ